MRSSRSGSRFAFVMNHLEIGLAQLDGGRATAAQ
jgi:hypothetical protein